MTTTGSTNDDVIAAWCKKMMFVAIEGLRRMFSTELQSSMGMYLGSRGNYIVTVLSKWQAPSFLYN